MFGFLKFNGSGQRIAELELRNQVLERRIKSAEAAYNNAVDVIDQNLKQIEARYRVISMRDNMLRICRDDRLKAEEAARVATFKLESAQDALRIFAERYRISAEELRQLQVADLVKADPANQGHEKATANFDVDVSDPLTLLNAGNDFKQTAGKFRQLRQSFVTLQLAITAIFDGLERAAKQKPVTFAQIRDARIEVSGKIGRKV